MSNKNTTKSPHPQTPWQHPIKPTMGPEMFKAAFIIICPECGGQDIQVYAADNLKRCRNKKCGATWL